MPGWSSTIELRGAGGEPVGLSGRCSPTGWPICHRTWSAPDGLRLETVLRSGGRAISLAHMMMLLGRHRRLVPASWTRPKYRRLTGRARITDRGIERAFSRYREFAGLALWLLLTEDWLSDDAAQSAAGGA